MLLLESPSHDPHFNLALEETVFRTAQEDVFMLWQNAPSIIVGRNQATLREIDVAFVQQHDLPVVRRMTGGGAVYHDLGNLNYSFVEVGAQQHFGDYARYAAPMLEALRALGIDAHLQGRNDLVVEDKKISGNAQWALKGRMLHHGTLLVHADLSVLARALRPDRHKIQSKGIVSTAARVANLKDFIPSLTVDVLKEALFAHMGSKAERMPICEHVLQAARALQKQTYDAWTWNYGASPLYTHEKSLQTEAGRVVVQLTVQQGIIEDVHITGDFMSGLDTLPVHLALCGVRHEEDALKNAIEPLTELPANLTKEVFVSLLL